MTTTTKPRVMSGMRASGRLHLGHLYGVLGQWVRYCDTADAFFEIADLHGYTTEFANPQKIRDARNEMVIDWLAAGVDPKRSTFFLQSAVPEISELQALLAMIVPVSWLERAPTYKGQIDELGSEIATYGFLGYPLLQLCDIAVVKGQFVPVGRDQAAHLEFGREVVRRFNYLYGDGAEILVEPQPTFSQSPEVPGIDGRKMSKSYDNAIYIGDDEETTAKKIHAMVTDPLKVRRGDPGRPEICPVFGLWKLLATDDTGSMLLPAVRLESIAAGCRSGALGCAQDKADFAEALNASLRDIRERRAALVADPSAVDAIITEGTARTREIAAQTLQDVKRAMKLL
ncbi:MAG TPA: tryptophan--tRNA ligase [Candidatus Baltobacteraceae bacterium]